MPITDKSTTNSPIGEEPIYTVSQLNAQVRALIEDSFQHIWLIGEISNLARPASGHLYFSLKDEKAQVRCALFKGAAKGLNFNLTNGQQVIAHANVSLYEARGDFQLIITKLELAGEGLLQLAFEKLKSTLQQQGLFDLSHKKPIPLVNTVGIITSDSGAAVRDVLHVLNRRCPLIQAIIYPTQVQGAMAKEQIVKAIETANQRNECDVLLLVRGGGSLEDLWAFNEEVVALAIFNSTLPVVTGIGHETDFTISDFVADARAPTPSAAAELISQDMQTWLHQLTQLLQRLNRVQQHHLQHAAHVLTTLSKRLRHPRAELKEASQHINFLQKQLALLLTHQLAHKKNKLRAKTARLLQNSPQNQLALLSAQYKTHTNLLIQNAEHAYLTKAETFKNLAQQLENISPLKTLQRGYAIVTKVNDQSLVKNANQLSPCEKIKIKLAKGSLISTVESRADD